LTFAKNRAYLAFENVKLTLTQLVTNNFSRPGRAIGNQSVVCVLGLLCLDNNVYDTIRYISVRSKADKMASLV